MISPSSDPLFARSFDANQRSSSDDRVVPISADRLARERNLLPCCAF